MLQQAAAVLLQRAAVSATRLQYAAAAATASGATTKVVGRCYNRRRLLLPRAAAAATTGRGECYKAASAAGTNGGRGCFNGRQRVLQAASAAAYNGRRLLQWMATTSTSELAEEECSDSRATFLDHEDGGQRWGDLTEVEDKGDAPMGRRGPGCRDGRRLASRRAHGGEVEDERDVPMGRRWYGRGDAGRRRGELTEVSWEDKGDVPKGWHHWRGRARLDGGRRPDELTEVDGSPWVGRCGRPRRGDAAGEQALFLEERGASEKIIWEPVAHRGRRRLTQGVLDL